MACPAAPESESQTSQQPEGVFKLSLALKAADQTSTSPRNTTAAEPILSDLAGLSSGFNTLTGLGLAEVDDNAGDDLSREVRDGVSAPLWDLAPPRDVAAKLPAEPFRFLPHRHVISDVDEPRGVEDLDDHDVAPPLAALHEFLPHKRLPEHTAPPGEGSNAERPTAMQPGPADVRPAALPEALLRWHKFGPLPCGAASGPRLEIQDDDNTEPSQGRIFAGAPAAALRQCRQQLKEASVTELVPKPPSQGMPSRSGRHPRHFYRERLAFRSITSRVTSTSSVPAQPLSEDELLQES